MATSDEFPCFRTAVACTQGCNRHTNLNESIRSRAPPRGRAAHRVSEEPFSVFPVDGQAFLALSQWIYKERIIGGAGLARRSSSGVDE